MCHSPLWCLKKMETKKKNYLDWLKHFGKGGL